MFNNRWYYLPPKSVLQYIEEAIDNHFINIEILGKDLKEINKT